jgi:hypothetical protein
MASMDLDHHQQETLRMILEHRPSANIEWRRVRSLLDAAGTTVEEPNGKLRVTVDGKTLVLTPPRTKDVDDQLLVDVRRLFEPS